MFTSKLRVALSIVLFVTTLAACDQNTSQPGQTGSSLKSALAFVPAASGEISFTDWTLLKKYMKLDNLPATRTEEQDKEFIQQMRSQAPTAMLDPQSPYLPDNPFLKTWSWDVADLQWETNIHADPTGQGIQGPPIEILKFRDDFDFAPVIAHFKDRGFAESDYAGAKLYSHPLTLTEDWETAVPALAIYNTALLADKKMLVLSSAGDNVKAVLDAAQKGGASVLAGDKAVSDMVDQLGEVGAASLVAGDMGCNLLTLDSSKAKLTPAQQELATELQTKLVNGHAYDAFATGYRYEGDQSLSFVALHFDSQDSAKADLPVRQDLFANGTSTRLAIGVTYDELLKKRMGSYQLDTSGTTLLMKFKGGYVTGDLDQVREDLVPKLIYQMFISSDMTFAACPVK